MSDFDKVATLLEKAVQDAVMPGAMVGVGDQHETVWEQAFGVQTPATGAPVTLDTHYDVASLTKPIATVGVAMKLYAASLLDLDQRVQEIIRSFEGPDKERVRVRDLLSHASGLPAHRPYFEEVRSKKAMLARAAAEPLEHVPGTRSVYSDVGFMLLGRALERLGGSRLDELAQVQVFEPLAMTETFFVPLPRTELIPEPVAPTEVCPRRGLVHGEVHDDNCHAAGGVMGHAGLFSCARDLARFARAVTRAHEGNPVPGGFTQDAVRTFLAPSGVPGSTWRLGWDGPAPTGSAAGELWPKSGSGHLAFTGCSLWLDPPRGRWVILLCNRVHPSRDNTEIRQLRPRVHDAVWQALPG